MIKKHRRGFIEDFKIRDILKQIDYFGKDATLREVYKEIKSEYLYKCPKCKGKGFVMEEKRDFFGYIDGEKEVKCDVCNGRGYTKKKYKPKYKLYGYKKEEEE